MLDRSVVETTFAFLDVETTGLRPQFGDRVCEVAVVRCVGAVETGRFVSLVNPGRKLSPAAAAVNGLTDAELHGQPTFAVLVPQLLSFLSDAVIVAHNAVFDVQFVNAELGRLGLGTLSNWCVDTLELARFCYRLPSHSLANLAHRFGLPNAGAHRALADALTTRGVLSHLIQDLGARWLSDLDPFVAGMPRAGHSLPAPLRQALVEGRRLRLRYQSSDGVTERLVEPLKVNTRHGSIYLVAYCCLRQEQRTFRLDRILAMQVEGEDGGR